MKTIKIETSEDDRESNLIRNKEGEVIGHKQSKYTCKVYLSGFWTPWNKEVGKILELVAHNEDKKYPQGLGRNMFLLKYVYPIFKEYLEGHGFKPNPNDLEFAQREGKNDQSSSS